MPDYDQDQEDCDKPEMVVTPDIQYGYPVVIQPDKQSTQVYHVTGQL